MISEALRISSTLRCPVFEKGTAASTKIDELESYLLLTAFHQGELSAERLELREELDGLRHTWDHLQGWEVHRRGKTDASIDTAKRIVRPELYDEIKDRENRIARLGEEIERLERDSVKVSRAYTFITGS